MLYSININQVKHNRYLALFLQDVLFLSQFMTADGKMLNRRVTGLLDLHIGLSFG